MAKRVNKLNVKLEQSEDFVLKVFGRDEFIFGDHHIIKFQYIQDSLSREIIPNLLILGKDSVDFTKDHYKMINNVDNKKSSFSTLTLRKKNKHIYSWSVNDNFKITLCEIKGINCDTKGNVDVSKNNLEYI